MLILKMINDPMKSRFYSLPIGLFIMLGICSFTTTNKSLSNITDEDTSVFSFIISNHLGDSTSIVEEYSLGKKHDWQSLYFRPDQRKFYLEPVKLGLSSFYDECNDAEIMCITSVSDEFCEPDTVSRSSYTMDTISIEEYIYLTGLDTRSREVPSHFHTQLSINPGTPYHFEFGGRQYTLRAEGQLPKGYALLNNADYDKDELGRVKNFEDGYGYSDYKLYLESEGITQLLNSGVYELTCLKILFIGDLDGDGKPDFLFDTNTWYEGSEVTLFLSSKANKGELVKNMGVSGNYYSC